LQFALTLTWAQRCALLPTLPAAFVMPGLVPGIHVLGRSAKKDVDGRVKPGHDGPFRA
jgi:hypothetical protein